MKWFTRIVQSFYYLAYSFVSKLFGRGSLVPLEFLSLQYKLSPPRDGCEYKEYVLRRMEHERLALRRVVFLPWQMEFIFTMILYHGPLNCILLIFDLESIVKELFIEYKSLTSVVYVGSFLCFMALIRSCGNNKADFTEYLDCYYTEGVRRHIARRNKSLLIFIALLTLFITSFFLVVT